MPKKTLTPVLKVGEQIGLVDPTTKRPVIATVADVMALLRQCPPDLPVACASDAEGNGFAALLLVGIEELAGARATCISTMTAQYSSRSSCCGRRINP